MRRLSTILLLTIISINLYSQANIGQPINDIQIKDLLNAPIKTTSTVALKNKVVLLEFWATWCSPCVEAMPHLQELQGIYKDDLQIITISTEKKTRISQFIRNRPSNLWFAIDSADVFRNEFPYHTIPHSVLIDKKGIVVAITEPKNITEKIIQDVIADKKITLPLKEDNMNKNPWDTYFFADSGTNSQFLVQPKIEGLGSGYKKYQNDSIFKNRRISMMNLPLETVYRLAYEGLPYGRSIDLTPKENVVENKKMYCMDIIVPRGKENELIPTLKKELGARFDFQANIEQLRRTVYVLKIDDLAKVKTLKKSNLKEEKFSASKGSFSGEGIQLKKIADYLEGFGLTDLPVVDETGNKTRYDIEFTFMPEKQGDLQNTLKNLGLILIKEERMIDMLIFR
jgi:uncharacterized protein (TIGR03435 family)